MSEKDYNPEQKNAKAMKQQEKAQKAKVVEAPVKTSEDKVENKKVEEVSTKGKEEVKNEPAKESNKKVEETKEVSTKGKKIKQKEAPKKEEVVVNAQDVPVSTKVAGAICRFIKWKTIEKAISDLEEVMKKRKAVPMRGEIAHRKGKIMSGKFPIRASEHFILVLKSLKGNTIQHDLENPIITMAMVNQAARPLGKFGTVQRKRTHITLKARTKVERKKIIKGKKEAKK